MDGGIEGQRSVVDHRANSVTVVYSELAWENGAHSSLVWLRRFGG